ncbi:MAG TPA: ABC transporter permease [Thermoanaerobaculia bacterium]|nr:ABC transporter permease [Thermoanaerobaculia bacterium]HQR66091.1 ABC transporter permease [Thermoanaerobaculia bacterium]
MKRLLTLVWKEFAHLRRDPITVRLIFFIPIFQTLLFGFAIDFDVKQLKTVVVDESRSFESRELVAKLTASDYFRVVTTADTLEAMGRELDAAHAAVGLVIDREYARNLRRGVPAEVLLVVNGSDNVVSSQAIAVASGVARQLSAGILLRRAGWKGADPPVDLRVRAWYNPELRTATFVIPGLLALILTFTLIPFTAVAIVREEERGTLEQLRLSPVSRLGLVVGKILPFLLIGLLQMTLVTGLMRFVFGIEVVGSVAGLYAAGLVFIFCVLGLGMLVSTAAKTQMQAVQLSFFFLLPFVFLSGYVFPIDGMPRFFQLLTYLIPARYFIEVIRGIVLRGAGLADLWPSVALLVLYAVVIVGAAALKFRKRAA